MKVALAGLAGVGAAWLIPHGAKTPAPVPSVTPSNATGVTAVELSLNSIPEGVSFQTIAGERVFLVRHGGSVSALIGRTTESPAQPLHWCRDRKLFAGDGGPFYLEDGRLIRATGLRDLDRLEVIVAAGRVTIFPQRVLQGRPATLNEGPPIEDCSASERVG